MVEILAAKLPCLFGNKEGVLEISFAFSFAFS